MPVKIGKLILFDISELSDSLNVTAETLRAYIQQGRIHGQKVGGKWFISETALADFFEPGSKQKLETVVRQRVQELSSAPKKTEKKKPAPRKRKEPAPGSRQDAGIEYKLPNIIKELRKKHGGYSAMARELAKRTGRKYHRKAVEHWSEQTRFPKPNTLKDICKTFNLDYDELHRNMLEAKLERNRKKLLSGQ